MELPSQRTAEVSCPYIYAQVHLYVQASMPTSPEEQGDFTSLFGAVVRSAARQMYGIAGAAALKHEVLGLLQQKSDITGFENVVRATGIVRLPKENFGRFLAGCAALSSYDGVACSLSISHASPHLTCLAGGGTDSSLAAGCLQKLSSCS